MKIRNVKTFVTFLICISLIGTIGCINSANSKSFEELKKNVSSIFKPKIDPFEIAEKYEFFSINALDNFRYSLPHNPYSNTDKAKFLDVALFNRAYALYDDIKDLKMEDFDRNGVASAQMAMELMSFKKRAEIYFENRKKALIQYEREEKAREAELKRKEEERIRAKMEAEKREQEAERQRVEAEKREQEAERQRVEAERQQAQQIDIIKKRKENAPSEIVSQFKNSPKPSNFEEMKKLILLLSEWKVEVYNWEEEWGFNYGSHVNNSKEIVFRNIPIDVSPYKDKYLFINASIKNRFGKDNCYIIETEYDYNTRNAIAVISREVINKSRINFHEDVYMVCKFIDIVDVETVIGTTKTIAMVKVEGTFRDDDYYSFIEYVLGHPKEFPQDRYVKVGVD